jgi:CHAT domain-containing protein
MHAAAMLIRSVQLGVLALSIGATPRLHAAECDSILIDRSAALDTVVELAGNAVANETARFPAHVTVVVVASEDGVDVMLDVSKAGQVIGRADNPVRRTGNQRVILKVDDSSDYVIALAGKEHRELKGRVRLRAVVFTPQESNDSCLGTQRLLAAGDTAYATGQRVTRHLNVESRLDGPGAYKLAAAQYEAAAQHIGPTTSELLAQSQLAAAAVLYQDIEDWRAASHWAKEAESMFAAVHDDYGEARAQAIEAASLIELAPRPQSAGSDATLSASATLQRARAMLVALAKFHTSRREPYDAALALNNIGWAYYTEGKYEAAVAAYRHAAAMLERLRERPRWARALQNIALVEYELGRFSEAALHYEHALSLVSPLDSPTLYPQLLNNTALVNWASGRYDLALRQYSQALELVREIQDSAAEAAILQNIGSVYYATGDTSFALEFYNEALQLSSVERNPVGRTALLRTIGNVLREQGSFSDALRTHEEALALASKPATKSQVLLQIARDLAALERTAEAQQRVSEVLERQLYGNEVLRARALLERARLRISVGDAVGAEADIRSAQRTFRAYDLPQDLFDGWLELARLRRRTGATQAAFDAVDKALALAEELRVQTANPELRATRLQPLRTAFDLKISMLADRYFAHSADTTVQETIALDALTTAEQARARALQDFRNLDASSPDVPSELLQQRAQIYRELAARRNRLEATLERASATDPRVALIRADIADLRRRLDQIDARIGGVSAAALPPSVGDRRNSITVHALPQDVAVVEYWLGADQTIAWAVTSEGVSMVRLAGTSSIDRAARSFLTALRGFGTSPPQRRLSTAEDLAALVLDPMVARVASKRILLFAPDGVLHYVPFAALRYQDSASKRFLIERYDVAVIPSISTLLVHDPVRPPAPPTRQMLLVADPVYTLDDLRLATRASTGSHRSMAATGLPLFRGSSGDLRRLPRLPGTAREAAIIAALLPNGSVDLLEGLRATRDEFLGASLGSYRFIHVASHAVEDAEVPQASALILSTLDAHSNEIDGRVLAADFVSVRLNADAVVLSACGTALGKNIAGEGLLGLQYVVLARGARSVVSSLWPVVDQPAAQFMEHFYSSLVRPESSALTALGAAMRAMLSTPFADPTHWGAFMLTISTLRSGD